MIKGKLLIKVFILTHCGNLVDDAIKFMNMGGYADFTAGEETPEILDYVMKKAPLERITLSSDANGSIPIWNDKKEVVRVEAAEISGLYENIKTLVKEYNVDIDIAQRLVSKNISEALQISNITGEIREGLSCDFISIDEDLNIVDVASKGIIELKQNEITRKVNFQNF